MHKETRFMPYICVFPLVTFETILKCISQRDRGLKNSKFQQTESPQSSSRQSRVQWLSSSQQLYIRSHWGCRASMLFIWHHLLHTEEKLDQCLHLENFNFSPELLESQSIHGKSKMRLWTRLHQVLLFTRCFACQVWLPHAWVILITFSKINSWR